MSRPIRHYGGWRIRWTDHAGKRRSEVHLTFKDAEFALRKNQQEADEVRRSLRSGIIENKTFEDLAIYYSAFYSTQKRRRRDDESIIRAHLKPTFGPLLLRSTNWTAEINQYKASRQNLSPKTVHNQLTLLVSMLIVARDLKWITEVPKIKKPKLRLFDRDFRYLRSNNEIRQLLIAAQSEGDRPYALYATALFTGMRQGELAGLKWADIDFEKRLITVQRSYDGPTKSGDLRFVPILNSLLPILRNWRLRNPTEYVFPNQRGGMLRDSARIFQETFHRVLENAAFPSRKEHHKTHRYIRFHDLRHTFASHWVMTGGDLFRLQKILGHKTVQMTMRYAHLVPGIYSEDYGRLAIEVPTGTILRLGNKGLPCQRNMGVELDHEQALP